MTGLLCVLWLLYVSECFARWRPGDWVFRPSALGGMQAVNEPDVTFLDGRFAFVWTTLLPWRTAHVCAGSAFDRRSDRVSNVSKHLTPVRVSSTVLFAVVLVVFPGLVLTSRFSPFAAPLAAAFGLAWAGTLGTFFHAYRRVHGVRPAAESWMLLALSPVDLIRAPHVVALRSRESLHPLIAAEALCVDDELLQIARLWHFDAPALRDEIQDLLERRGLRGRLSAPPSRIEPGLAVYCARCHSMFREGTTVCPDCDDIELTPLPGAVPNS